MTGPQVLIAGAGPTGLVLALWLTKLGVRVRIVDKAAAPGTTSRALGVQARTLELYRQIGLADAVIDGGVKVAGANVWGRGKKIARVPLGQIGSGMSLFSFALMFAQDDHERLLIERLNATGVAVERQTTLKSFEVAGARVVATLTRPDGSIEACEAAYLAGCDGAHSVVREQLSIGFPGGTYTGLFYVADVQASGMTINNEVHVDLDDGEFLGVFPLKGEGRIRLIGAARERTDRELTFEDVRGRAIEHIGLRVEKVNWFSTYRVHHRVADRFRRGRAFLLGDAAHIHSPVGAQGMNTGIGDAINLSWKLAAVLNTGAGDELLDTYEEERIRFARLLVATTDRVFTFVTAPGAIAEFIRLRIAPRLLPLAVTIAPLRRFLFRTVSQLGLNYHHSPLSVGSAGGVRGGDRLPWVVTEPGCDNFEPLTSLAWQAHVYGAAASELESACIGLGLRLYTFDWKPEMASTGLRQDALYLVRPDGYVALADPSATGAGLRRYFEQRRGYLIDG